MNTTPPAQLSSPAPAHRRKRLNIMTVNDCREELLANKETIPRGQAKKEVWIGEVLRSRKRLLGQLYDWEHGMQPG